jgi:hypothetical protein
VGEDLGQAVDVHRELGVLSSVAALDAVDQLRPQDVDPAVQQPAAVGDLLLFSHEVVDLNAQVVIGQRCEIG